MYSTDDLHLFIAVVELGNFSNAAKQLNVNSTTIGRQIKALEENLGISLIIRDTKSFELTNAGKELYNLLKLDLEKIKSLSKSLDQKIQDSFNIKSEPSGKLRVMLPPSLSFEVISEELPKFMKQYPKIDLSVNYNIKTDSIDDGVDFSVSNLLPTKVNYMVKHLVTVRYKLYCSKQYAEKYGIPESIEQLDQHLTTGSSVFPLNSKTSAILRNVAVSHDKSGAEYIVSMPERFVTNTTLHNIRFVSSHEAICALTKYAVGLLSNKIELVQILPEYTFGENKFYSIRHPYNNDKAVKVFADFIDTIFKTYDSINQL